MEHKFNYTIVGMFVLGFIACLIALIIWLTNGFEKVNTIEYRVITNESVSGLSVNSPIDYRGVDVGKVASMELNHDDPRYVTIYLNIDVGTPIKNDTEAVLMSRGITGLVNVSLTGGTPEAGALLPSKADPIPTIKNGASLSRRLDEALNNVTHSLSELSKKMGLILTTENIDNLSNILSNTNTFTADLATVGDKINVLTEKATGTIDTIQPQIKDAAQAFSSFADHLQGSTKQLENMSVKINSTLDSAESTLNTWGSLGQEANGSLQDVFPVLENALYNFSLFMQELEAKPNSIILGKPQQKPGPGE
ncbi:MAG TPA: MCE family protein [Candidatus Ignatzschineria merdigallinarum]|uniref:MCE family protein n=1 Tax=Candidatus Ignatzschineria merdigallinarum TaxID=2838621 RepID=A0A9D1Q5Z8_9GAMM|nr:MCE family protein [Candidatus Ignatzschineria merdigallinarum]